MTNSFDELERTRCLFVIGSNTTVAHPMVEEHWIQWIALETTGGNQRKELHPGDEPKAVFLVPEEDEIVAAYEYCNLHGLWKK